MNRKTGRVKYHVNYGKRVERKKKSITAGKFVQQLLKVEDLHLHEIRFKIEYDAKSPGKNQYVRLYDEHEKPRGDPLQIYVKLENSPMGTQYKKYYLKRKHLQLIQNLDFTLDFQFGKVVVDDTLYKLFDK